MLSLIVGVEVAIVFGVFVVETSNLGVIESFGFFDYEQTEEARL